MTIGQRIYYLALAAFCYSMCLMCLVIQGEIELFSSRWWVCFFGLVYACQPFINIAKAGIQRVWPKRETHDYYRLEKSSP